MANKTSILAVTLFFAFALSMFGQTAEPRPLPAVMNDMESTMQIVDAWVEKAPRKVHKQAVQIVHLFSETAGFYARAGVQNGTSMAVQGQAAANRLAASIQSNDMAAVKASVGAVKQACNNCHSKMKK